MNGVLENNFSICEERSLFRHVERNPGSSAISMLLRPLYGTCHCVNE